MTHKSNDNHLRELKKVYADEGPRAALSFLNSLTSQRFTSLYRFDDEKLHCITLYDRENPEVNTSEDIPLQASYCVFVRDTGKRFETADAEHDERVKNHPKRNEVRSYCGVPLLDQDGKMFGSICHFDLKPGRISDLDVELLESMAGLLKGKLAGRA